MSPAGPAAQVAAVQALAAGTPALGQLGADGLARFVTGNFWSEDAQADALAGGDVSAFSRTHRLGARCAARRSTRRAAGARQQQPLVRLVARPRPGRRRQRPGQRAPATGEPNVLGRIQPYAVYVPTHLPAPAGPAPLTWILHSLDVNHHQYAAYDPRLLQQLCERRGSICASTLGHGPDGWYYDEAEVDYWSVWREAARGLPPRPDAAR